MKRSTAVLLLIFLALAGLTFYLRQNKPADEELDVTPVPTAEFLISSNDGIPTSIDIQSQDGQRVTIRRNEDGLWVLDNPIEAEAGQGSAEAAATQMTSLRIISRPEVAPDIVGLNPASFTLTVKLTGGDEKVVRIGDLAPTGSGYYASVNDSNEVFIISQAGLDSLLVMLESPPYAETPIP